jgi:integrase
MPLKLYPRPNGIWHIRGTVQRQRVDFSSRTRIRAEAEAIRAKHEADLFQRSVYGDKAVAEFAEAAEMYMRAGGERVHLAPLLLKIGTKRLADINQDVIDRLAGERPDAKPATLVRQIYTPVAAVMNFAEEQGLCGRVKFRKPTVRNARVDYLKPDEAEKLLSFLPAHLKALVTFYIATGCRATEALDLDWRDVSPEGEHVVFWDTKEDYARGVKLQRRARALLPERSAGPVWLNLKGEPWHAYDAVNLMLKRHCARNGFRPVHCHLFRHTWATWAYASTRDLTFLQQQGGWRSATMVLRYAHAASDDLARAVLAQGWEFFGRELPGLKPKGRKS